MTPNATSMVCPRPAEASGETITLAHGEGGLLSRRLIQREILPLLGCPSLESADGGRCPWPANELVMSTDSFVVSPLFFPGGDIGTLAVYGTANDLAVSGARPRLLTLSLILEEGLPLAILRRVLTSIRHATVVAGMTVVTGDTKVVPRGAVDGLFINTCGIGELVQPVPPGPAAIRPGDEVLVSGPIGRHGVAVLAAREGLGLEPAPESDCGPLLSVADALRDAGVQLRALRDATRGGVAAVLHEWAQSSGCMITIDESRIPVSTDVRGASELLGLDPLHIANEGTLVAALAPGQSVQALAALATVPQGRGAALIGVAEPAGPAPVAIRRALGRRQALDEPLGAPLPRIC